jgi:hypothetical protein
MNVPRNTANSSPAGIGWRGDGETLMQGFLTRLHRLTDRQSV